MSTNIYVGNLPFNSTEDEIRDLFAAHGAVTSVTLIVDRETGRLRGFGFVEMEEEQEANAAIEGLNGVDLQGRSLTVNIARPREDRGGGGRGGGGGGGGNRGGGGGGRDRRW
ncbi:MAG: RNA-binding protein [Candidatus Tectomicrobia bacterium]